MVSGIAHATPSFETFALVIPLTTYRVLARSASGCVQPAAGWPVAAGAVPVTAAPRVDGHASVLELLLLLLPPPEQPPAIRAVATTSAAPATTGRRAPDLLAALLISSPIPVLASLTRSALTVARPARPSAGVKPPTLPEAG